MIKLNSAPANKYAMNSLTTKGDGLMEKRYPPNTTNSITKRKMIPNTLGISEYTSTEILSRNLVLMFNDLFTNVKQYE